MVSCRAGFADWAVKALLQVADHLVPKSPTLNENNQLQFLKVVLQLCTSASISARGFSFRDEWEPRSLADTCKVPLLTSPDHLTLKPCSILMVSLQRCDGYAGPSVREFVLENQLEMVVERKPANAQRRHRGTEQWIA